MVIPTLNESASISAALDSLEGQEGLLETIVVDGGSTDGTRAVAEARGTHVVNGPRGRGLQISEGIDQCRGDVILVLHADCRIRPRAFERIGERLNRDSLVVGGSLGMAYDSHGLKTRFLSWLNNVRARYIGIAFGDQCQFFRRRSVPAFGGYPAQMLMEDIELSLRLKASGTVCFIPEGVVVSQRRWEEKGFIRNFIRVVVLSSSYLLLRYFKPSEIIAEDFYTRYYEKS